LYQCLNLRQIMGAINCDVSLTVAGGMGSQ